MADLITTYSKTPKGLRARASLIGGLSGKLFKVLSFIDGVSRAQTILTKHDDISAEKLLEALTKLENEGYIKPVVNVVNDDDDWDFGDSAEQIVVEEFSFTKQEEVLKQSAVEQQALLEAERQTKAAELIEQQAKQKQAKQAELDKQLELEKQVKLEKQAKPPQPTQQEKPQENTRSKVSDADKELQQQVLIKAIQKAKAETKVQELLKAEKVAAEAIEAQKLLKLEELAKVRAIQLEVAEFKLAATSAKAAQARLEKARSAQDAATIKAEKAVLLAQKVAFAEAEQLRLMDEFEAQSNLETAAKQQSADSALHEEQVARAELVADAKAKLKAKAQARAEVDEQLALEKTAEKRK